MRRSFFFAMCVTLLATSPAMAGVKVCNKSNLAASVAWAMAQNFMGKVQAFVWGWTPVAAGACETLNSVPESPYNGRPTQVWYLYAKSENGHWGSGGAQGLTDSTGKLWDKVMNICEPSATSPEADDFSRVCNRLPYTIVNEFDGADYRADLIP